MPRVIRYLLICIIAGCLLLAQSSPGPVATITKNVTSGLVTANITVTNSGVVTSTKCTYSPRPVGVGPYKYIAITCTINNTPSVLGGQINIPIVTGNPAEIIGIEANLGQNITAMFFPISNGHTTYQITANSVVSNGVF